MLRRGFGGSQEDLERTCLCSTVPTEHGNAASQYASGLQHDLQVAYSRLVRKKKCGKEGTLRVDVTRVFLPHSATPHFREIVVEHTQGQHDTPKHSSSHISTALQETSRRRARAQISDLTYIGLFFFTAAYITWLVLDRRRPADVT